MDKIDEFLGVVLFRAAAPTGKGQLRGGWCIGASTCRCINGKEGILLLFYNDNSIIDNRGDIKGTALRGLYLCGKGGQFKGNAGGIGDSFLISKEGDKNKRKNN